ncbi:hypothetical protein K438DRAFT_1935749 [Mycena galopus ATCC 62051]|nr:hypothetical protein K438DRAFT_1935749 [Mycena galopus ATCC 62051]
MSRSFLAAIWPLSPLNSRHRYSWPASWLNFVSGVAFGHEAAGTDCNKSRWTSSLYADEAFCTLNIVSHADTECRDAVTTLNVLDKLLDGDRKTTELSSIQARDRQQEFDGWPDMVVWKQKQLPNWDDVSRYLDEHGGDLGLCSVYWEEQRVTRHVDSGSGYENVLKNGLTFFLPNLGKRSGGQASVIEYDSTVEIRVSSACSSKCWNRRVAPQSALSKDVCAKRYSNGSSEVQSAMDANSWKERRPAGSCWKRCKTACHGRGYTPLRCRTHELQVRQRGFVTQNELGDVVFRAGKVQNASFLATACWASSDHINGAERERNEAGGIF